MHSGHHLDSGGAAAGPDRRESGRQRGHLLADNLPRLHPRANIQPSPGELVASVVTTVPHRRRPVFSYNPDNGQYVLPLAVSVSLDRRRNPTRCDSAARGRRSKAETPQDGTKTVSGDIFRIRHFRISDFFRVSIFGFRISAAARLTCPLRRRPFWAMLANLPPLAICAEAEKINI